MKKTIIFFSINLLLVLSLLSVGCVIPAPTVPELPSPIKPANTYTLGEPINPGWVPPPSKETSTLLSLPITEIVKKVTPSVVAIQTEVIAYDIFYQPIPRQGAGTGIIIDSQGYVATNSHVVEDAESIKVTLTDGRTFSATKVNSDAWTDLAVIEIDAKDLPEAEIGNSDELAVGEGVVAIGNALALEGGPTVTSGIVSYIGRSIREPNDIVLNDLIQTDAAINPGNSGGPLLNMAGQVVGINTAIAAEAENIGFAISISPALPIIEQLIREGRVIRPWLGVNFFPTSDGVVLTYIDLGSPADKAGLRIGDIITSFDGQKVSTAGELRQAVIEQKIGEKVEIFFIRNGVESKTTAILIESPPR